MYILDARVLYVHPSILFHASLPSAATVPSLACFASSPCSHPTGLMKTALVAVEIYSHYSLLEILIPLLSIPLIRADPVLPLIVQRRKAKASVDRFSNTLIARSSAQARPHSHPNNPTATRRRFNDRHRFHSYYVVLRRRRRID